MNKPKQDEVISAPTQTSPPDQSTKENDLSKIKIPEEKFRMYNSVFDEMDIDSSGAVSKDEFEKVLSIYCQEMKLPQTEIDKSFSAIDQDHNGSVTLFEFLRSIEQGQCPFLVRLVEMIGQDDKKSVKFQKLEQLKKKKVDFNSSDPIPYARDVLRMPEFQRNKYQKAFGLIDLDNSGRVTRKEFGEVVMKFKLIKNATDQEIIDLFNTIDIDGGGEISLLEFWTSLGSDKPIKKLAALVDAILNKEKDILAYIKKQGIKRMANPVYTVPVQAKPPVVVEETKEEKLKREMEERIKEMEKKFLQEKEKLNQEIGKKDAEIEKLREMVKQKGDENTSLLTIKEQSEQKIQELEKGLDILEEDKKNLSKDKAELETVKNIIESVANNILKNKDTNINDAQEKSTESQLRQIETEFVHKTNELSTLAAKLETLDKENQQQRDTLHAKELTESTLKKEAEDLSTKITALEQDRNELKQTEEDLKNRITELEHHKEALNVTLTKANNEMESVQADKDESIKEINRLNSKLSEMMPKEEFNRINEAHGNAKEINQNLLNSEISLKEEKAKLEAKNVDLQERINNLEKYKEETSEEIAKLTSQLQDCKSKINQDQSDIQHLTAKVSSMTSHEETEILKQSKDALDHDNTELKNSIEELKHDKSTLEIEKARLTEQLQEVEKLKTESISKNDQLIGDLEKLKSVTTQEIQQLQNDLQKEKEENECFNKVNQKLNEDLIFSDTEKSALKERIQQLEKLKRELTVDIIQLREKLEKLRRLVMYVV